MRERERERYLKEVVDHIKLDDRLATDIVIDHRDIHILQCIAAHSKYEAPHYIIICPQSQRLLIADPWEIGEEVGSAHDRRERSDEKDRGDGVMER